MKADKYLESIGLSNVIDEEFFNDDDKSWYKVQELMESYHKKKLDLLTIPVVSTTVNCDCTAPTYRDKHRNHRCTKCNKLNNND